MGKEKLFTLIILSAPQLPHRPCYLQKVVPSSTSSLSSGSLRGIWTPHPSQPLRSLSQNSHFHRICHYQPYSLRRLFKKPCSPSPLTSHATPRITKVESAMKTKDQSLHLTGKQSMEKHNTKQKPLWQTGIHKERQEENTSLKNGKNSV